MEKENNKKKSTEKGVLFGEGKENIYEYIDEKWERERERGKDW